MLLKARFYRGGHTYFGKGIAGDGYMGDADIIPSAVTMVIIKPGATLEAVKRSLEITLLEVEERIKQEGK